MPTRSPAAATAVISSIAELERAQDDLLGRLVPGGLNPWPCASSSPRTRPSSGSTSRRSSRKRATRSSGRPGRGDEAVALVREHKPDLAILDIRMPGMDGLSAAREITAERRRAVLILTAYSQRNLIEEARDAGALAYLVKPFQRSELIPAIEVALGRHNEMRALEDEVSSLEDQLETRRLVDRAKGILMDDYAMKEADAFSFIQKHAMQQRVTMRVMAQKIIDGAVRPDPPA